MHNYGRLLKILSGSLYQSISNTLARMELTAAQGNIMGYLSHCQTPPCARDVEEHFQLSHPTVSGILTRLEKKEFIALREDSKDRRIKRIYILPKGKACDERILQTIHENEARIVQGFTEEEKEQFAQLLIRAAQNMGADTKCIFKQEETEK